MKTDKNPRSITALLSFYLIFVFQILAKQRRHKRAGRAGNDRIGSDNLVQIAVQLFLQIQIFRNTLLQEQSAVDGFLQVVRSANAGELFGGGQRSPKQSLPFQAVQLILGQLEGFLDHLGDDIENGDLVANTGEQHRP